MKDKNFINFLNSEYNNAKKSLEKHEALERISDELHSCEKRYSNENEIDQGGMKVISRVYDKITDRTLVKAKSKFPDDKDHTELFLREARITASLQHPNIVPIHDIGFDPDNSPYFIMKMIEGNNFHEYLNENHSLPTKLSAFLKICDGVDFAHSQGIVHLDLKPANIRVGEHGEVIIFDWGLAKVIYEDCKEELLKKDSLDFCNLQLTLYGRGTPGYMAPEQFKNGAPLTRQSDIFSLGAILYFILTGQAPYEGKSYEDIKKKTLSGNHKPPSLAKPENEIPLGLEAICMKALQNKPAERYQTVEEMIKEVSTYMNGFAPKAENAGFATQLKLLYLRNKAIVNVALAALLIIIIGLSWFISKIKESENINRLAKEKLEAEAERRKSAENTALRSTVSIAWKNLQNADLKGAMDQTSIAIHYAPTYIEPYRLATLINLAKFKFQSALEYSSELPAEKYPDLRNICLKLANSKNTQPDYIEIVKLFKISSSEKIYPFIISNSLKNLDAENKRKFISRLLLLHNSKLNENEIYLSADLSVLKISSGRFTDIPPMPLAEINKIDFSGCPVTSIDSALFPKAAELNISRTALTDFNFLLNMPSLKKLTVDKDRLPEKITKALNCTILEK